MRALSGQNSGLRDQISNKQAGNKRAILEEGFRYGEGVSIEFELARR